MNVHLVYPNSNEVKTPFAIGRELTVRLRRWCNVIVHGDHRAKYQINPNVGDILLGHPSWDPNAVFNSSLKHPNWSKKICIHPFAPIDLRQTAHLDGILKYCDAFLAITGSYWIKTLDKTRCKHFAPICHHLDLAVRKDHFPQIKKQFNKKNDRRFLYIGNHPWYKNLGYLDKIASSFPKQHFYWIGSKKSKYKNLIQKGKMDFAGPNIAAEIARYDFLITVGNADANPTTILEAMSWGLIPVCTPQSGYDSEKGIINIPLDDVESALETIKFLQEIDEEKLRDLQEHNWRRIDEYYNWDRFADDVWRVISEIDVAPKKLIHRADLIDKMLIKYFLFASPNSHWRLKKIIKRLSNRKQ